MHVVVAWTKAERNAMCERVGWERDLVLATGDRSIRCEDGGANECERCECGIGSFRGKEFLS